MIPQSIRNNDSLAAKNREPYFSSFRIQDASDHASQHLIPEFAATTETERILKGSLNYLQKVERREGKKSVESNRPDNH
jgi:hypothetical protein